MIFSPQQQVYPVLKLPARMAAGWGIGIAGLILTLGWRLAGPDPGAWLGLGAWSLFSGWSIFSILTTGGMNPYRWWWFACLALGTLGAVLGTSLPEVAKAAPDVCPIAVSTTVGGVVAHAANAFLGQGHDTWSYVSGLAFLLFAGLVGTAWCSWVCGYGAWDESLSRVRARRPLWVWTPPKGLGQYLNVGIWGALMLVTWMQRETLFCQWVCPFKLTEAVGTPAGVNPLWPMLTMFGVGGVFIVVLPLLTGKRTFCRYLCPFGAWQSLWSRWHPWQRAWNATACQQCKQCQAVCPMQAIRIEHDQVRIDRMCNHCGRCEDQCPGGALSLTWIWLQTVPHAEGRRWARTGFVVIIGLLTGTLGAGVWVTFGRYLWHALINKG